MLPSGSREAKEILISARLKRTPGRVEALAVLLRARSPLSHQEILERTSLSRVSVYRALESFRAAGIVHRIEAGDRLWRFAVCDCGHSVHCHPHFTCRLCGEVQCLNRVALPAMSGALGGCRVEELEVYLRGVCAKCLGKEA